MRERGSHETGESNTGSARQRETNSGAESRRHLLEGTVSRRGALKHLTAVGGAVATGVSLSGGVAATDWDEWYSEGSYEDGGSVNSMDVEVVDMSSSFWDKGEEVFDGIVDGLQLLTDELWAITGFRVRLYDIDYEFTGDNSWSDLETALETNGFDDDTHYHVVYNGSLPPSKVGSYHSTLTGDDTMWHDWSATAISGLSLNNTAPLTVNAYVRGLHQLMHNYINDDIATEYADTDDGYDAVHELGASTDDARTVMADTYPTRAYAGECDDTDCVLWCGPGEDALAFSDCTLDAVSDSILENWF